jgi:hypothetical protein
VKNNSKNKMKRDAVDKANLEAFWVKHPKRDVNTNGTPRWEGSEAECLLRNDLEEILKLPENEIKTKLVPKVLYHQQDRPAYRVFSLPIFRNHIYQEQRFRKFLRYSEAEKNEPNKNKVMEE